ncbi:MAG: hypothetical protein ABF289_05695, partial [Clostridiales bacterium]
YNDIQAYDYLIRYKDTILKYYSENLYNNLKSDLSKFEFNKALITINSCESNIDIQRDKR